MSSARMSKVVTANQLRSGEVVYLAADGAWQTDLAAAAVADDDAALAALEAIARAAVEANKVTSVYAMDVAVVDARPQPVSVREQIRAARAPSV